MARRSNKTARTENVFVLLIESPWQVSALLAVVTFIFMKWIFPSMMSSSTSAPLAALSSGFAPIFSTILLLLGAISFFRHRTKSPAIYPVASNSKSTPRAYFREEPGFNVKPTSASDSLDRMPNIPPIHTELKSSPPLLQKSWSLELLQTLEWKRFEIVCAEYYRLLGKTVETISHGADGGLDARVYGEDPSKIELGIQCKAWGSMVGVNIVRELLGVITHESACKGILMTTSKFSEDAKSLAHQQSEKLQLVDGDRFLSMIAELSDEFRQLLLEIATEGDYTTPTCASCGEKMILKSGANGEFWACKKFPRLHSTMHLRKQDKVFPKKNTWQY